MAAEEVGDRLMSALARFEAVADEVTPDEALEAIDEASLQVFWRDWPNISGWAGTLWRRLDEDLAGPATAARDPDLDEVGGSG